MGRLCQYSADAAHRPRAGGTACEVQRLGSGMLRDIHLEGGGERLESQSFSCCVSLMARVRASRAHMCSVSSLVTTIWSAVYLGSVSGER